MKKILTVLAIASFSSLFSQITINTNFPSMIEAGSSTELDVKINKGALVSFAKYHIDVPVGYSVYLIDAKGGSFTFENQRGKIVWVSVPSDPEFSVKLKLQANDNAVSPGTFAQKFYYIVDNEKKEVSATPAVITIGKPNPSDIAANNTATATETKTNNEPTKTSDNLASSNTNTENKSSENNATTKTEKTTTDAVANTNNTLDSKNTNNQPVNSTNTSVSNNSKATTETSASTSGNETSKSDNKLATSSTKTDGNIKTNSDMASSAKQSDVKNTDSKNTNQSVSSNSGNTASESKSSSGNSKSAVTKNTDSKITSSNETKTVDNSVVGMTFKVQIGAYSSQPAKSLFTKAGKVNIDLIDGMYKVTTGTFNTLEEALKFRDEMQTKGFNDSFIAKYKNGSRIN